MASKRREKASSKRARPLLVRIGDAVVTLHALEKVVRLRVGKAVVGLVNIGAFAEERIGLIEEQQNFILLGAGKQLAEILLGLSDVLGSDGREIDAKQGNAQIGWRARLRRESYPCLRGRRKSARTEGR